MASENSHTGLSDELNNEDINLSASTMDDIEDGILDDSSSEYTELPPSRKRKLTGELALVDPVGFADYLWSKLSKKEKENTAEAMKLYKDYKG